MDAVEFLKERERMCKEYPSCRECPFGENEQGFHSAECALKYSLWPAESLVTALEAWISSHPKTTNAMKFKEVFGVDLEVPSPPIYDNQVLTYNGVVISDWLKQPYKEPKKGL